jgi:predicted PurR-regulated permease PerM
VPTIRADRLFFYILLSLALLATIVLVWPYIGAVVLAVTVAVVLQPLHRFFLRLARGHNGPATVLTMIATGIMVVIPVLLGFVLLLDAFSALAEDLAGAVQAPRDSLMQPLQELEAWIIQSGIADRIAFQQGDIQQTAQSWFSQLGSDFIGWVASIGMSTFNLIVPFIVFFSLLGTLLAYGDRTIQLVKDISPMDDAIDQLFLDRLRIMTRAMMRSIIIVAFAQGAVTGLLMAVGSTPHIIPLTILAMLLAILPGGAALVAVPVGLIHLYVGNTWQGAIIILASVTFIAGLDNQLRPLLVSKDAYLNRALVLLSVFSGIALFGFMGVVYGPLIMIFASTTLEVYLGYFHPDVPEATPQPVTSPESPTDSESEQ